MTSKLWTLIIALIGARLSQISQDVTTSTNVNVLFVPKGECQRSAPLASNETQGTAWVQSEGSCTERDYNPEEDELITEASYVPPLNLTYPAPKATDTLGSDLGMVQSLDSAHSKQILARIEKSREYMQRTVMVEEKYERTRSICQNKHENCAFWSVLGECENNPGYMHLHCAPVCETCEMLSVETRCPIDPDAVSAWSEPGDLNETFASILSNPVFQVYQPTILSQPPEGPWLIQFDNFISEEEAQRLIELGHDQEYERSTDVGRQQPDGTYSKDVNNGRTSTNAWCVEEGYTDPVARRVMARIENVTGVPETNSENLQLLRYKVGEFYQTHNDFIPYHTNRQCGVRIMTFYMYLSDVEEGGGTNFPKLGLTVTPKRGRAVLWPSVLDSNPNAVDTRTNHQALPVTRGEKYGANAWIHQRDFKGPNIRACN